MSSSPKCPTKLIPDTPAIKDQFRPHQKVAVAIAELIKSEKDGGKSIGLEGGWGSGKTTIVGLLCDELKPLPNQDPIYKVVLFDAWAHEGDPLRRTFLETIIDRLTEGADKTQNWIDKRVWDEQKEIIAQRKEIKKTRSNPHLSKLGYAVIAAIALVPVGLAFLNSSLKDTAFRFNNLQPNSIRAAIGIILSLGPLLLILGGRLFGNKNRSAASTTGGAIWAMLINKAITKETSKTNKTPNPTSVEFESYFAELMKEALETKDTKKERKIVLVLDNLDRINPTEALKILSTLQTFLNPRVKEDKSDSWQKRVWVVIPYDFEGLSQLWGKEKADKKELSKTEVEPGGKQENSAPPTDADAVKSPFSPPQMTENLVALSFLDKSFQIRFEVPPPVLSSWRVYLEGLMKEAFEDHKVKFDTDPIESEELYNVYTLYAWYLKQTNRLPTPRQLKLYVNQIGAIHRQWGDTHRFSHMAYYVLLRRLGLNVVDMVRNGQLPTPDVKSFLAPDADVNLSALAFNTSVEEAKQIILGNPIQEAFDTRDYAALSSLYQTHQDKGFWEALVGLAQTRWANYSSLQLANAAYCLDNSALFKQPLPSSSQPLASSVKKRLRNSAQAIPDWDPLDTQTAEGMASLFELIPDVAFVKSVLYILSIGVGLKVGQNYRRVDYPSWAAAMVLIKGKLGSLNFEPVYKSHFIENLKGRLLATSTPDIIKLTILLECLCELRLKDLYADEAITDLVINGHISHWIGFESETPDSLVELDIRKLSASIFLLKNPRLSKPPDIEHAIAGFDILVKWITPEEISSEFTSNLSGYLAGFLTKHNALENLFIIHQTRPDTGSFVVKCLQLVAENQHTPYVFTPEIIEREWQLFSQLTKGEFNASPLDKLVRRSLDQANFVEAVCASTFNPDLARFYSSMALQGADKNARFPDWLHKGLQSISKEMWIADIDKASPSYLIRLLISAPFLMQHLALPDYRDALVEIAQETMALNEAGKYGKISGPEEANTLIRNAGSDTYQTEVRQRIFQIAIEANGEISEEFLRVFGREISYRDLLDQDARTFSGLFTPLLKTGNLFRQDWLAKVLQSHPDLADKLSNSEEVREFRLQVRKSLLEKYSGKTVSIQATASKPPSVSISLGKVGEVWTPPTVPNENEGNATSSPSTPRYNVDPITAAFAIQSGWFEETSDSPFSWNPSATLEKHLATNDPIMEIAIIIGVMPDNRQAYLKADPV